MPHLLVTLCDGKQAHIPVPEGVTVEVELRSFLEKSGAYAAAWVKIGDDEYVRYAEITRVQIVR